MRISLQTSFEAYLCGAAPVQKGLAKPDFPRDFRERRQGRRVTACREVAGQLYLMGTHAGLAVVRVSVPWTKHRAIPREGSPEGARRFCLRAVRVLGAFTSGKWSCGPTGEFPHRPGRRCPLHRPARVNPRYNTWWKCAGYAIGEQKAALAACSLGEHSKSGVAPRVPAKDAGVKGETYESRIETAHLGTVSKASRNALQNRVTGRSPGLDRHAKKRSATKSPALSGGCSLLRDQLPYYDSKPTKVPCPLREHQRSASSPEK
jgi:hypothetical protein